jgi:hypothetical protein
MSGALDSLRKIHSLIRSFIHSLIENDEVLDCGCPAAHVAALAG